MDGGRHPHYEGAHTQGLCRRTRTVLGMQLTFADFVLTCNERQRIARRDDDFARADLSSLVYDRDSTLRATRFGAARHPARAAGSCHPAAPGVRPGFEQDDKIIIWNGGIIQWYDRRRCSKRCASSGATTSRALPWRVVPRDQEIGKGVRFQDAKAIAARNGQLDRTVFFEEGWVSHEIAKRYVQEADLGVCTYFDNLETRYSHRTRFVDLIWAELPFICTHGDVLAQEVEDNTWGIVVPQEDPAALAAAIEKLADDSEFRAQCRTNLAAARPSLQWDETMKPLIRFCSETGSTSSPRGAAAGWRRVATYRPRTVSTCTPEAQRASERPRRGARARGAGTAGKNLQ